METYAKAKYTLELLIIGLSMTGAYKTALHIETDSLLYGYFISTGTTAPPKRGAPPFPKACAST